MKKLVLVLPVLMLLFSCTNQQMKLTQSAYTVQDDLLDHSPIYIETGEDGVSAKLNQANKIGGTNFVFNIERELNLKQVAEMVQKIKDNKYEEDKMHTDGKGVFYSYADTLKKELAFYPFQKINFAFTKPATTDNLLYVNASKDLFYQNEQVQRDQLKTLLGDKDSIQLGASFSLDFQTYLQLRILLNELELEPKFNTTDLVY